MKIPKKVHYSGFDYKVVEVEKLDDNANWGRLDPSDCKIFLEKSVSQDRKEQTFVHELLHIAYRHTFSEIDNDKEEKLVKAWSMNIYGILKDNNLLK